MFRLLGGWLTEVMTGRVVAVAVVMAACGGPQEAGETSTSASEAPTSTAASTTTSEASSTTALPTTTEGSTTTTEATTSTTVFLAGAWADQPLIVADFGALGWWDGSEWVRAEEVGALPVVGGEDYQVSLLGQASQISGGSQATLCEPVLNLGVQLDEPELLGEWPGPYGIAISAGWELHPHIFQSFSDDGSYAGFARELLASRGLEVPNPVIKQLFRTDLEGDGTNEVLVVVEEVSPGLFGEEGDYSIAFMRKIVQNDVQTAVLGEAVILDPEDDFLIAFTVGTVADLNGDGQMEIVVDSAYYEGLGVEVWEYADDDLGPVPRLSAGCGA